MATKFKVAGKAAKNDDEAISAVKDKRINKQRVLLLCSRGIVQRYVPLRVRSIDGDLTLWNGTDNAT